MAVRTRLELATPCVTGRYSNQLNYRTELYDCDLSVSGIAEAKITPFSEIQAGDRNFIPLFGKTRTGRCRNFFVLKSLGMQKNLSPPNVPG